MKSYLVVLFCCTWVPLTWGQNIKLSKKGDVDVAYVYKDPFDYFDYPRDRTFEMRPATRGGAKLVFDDGLRNVSSMALRIRVWTILDNIATNPVFVYKLNMEGLSGNKYYVNFYLISKYPDLVRRYKAIRPSSFSAVVGMGLNPDDKYQYGAYAFFKVAEKDVLITSSEQTPFGLVPNSGSWGSKAIMVYSDQHRDCLFRSPKDFKPSDAEKDAMYKSLMKTTYVAPYAWAKVQTGTVREVYSDGNMYVKIDWPGDAIDAIQELYQKYEMGLEKPPSKEAEEKLAKKDSNPYNENDEWATPFEDDLKDVQAITDYNKKLIALKSKDRIIKAFDNTRYARIEPLKNTSFFLLVDRNNRYTLVDKRGNPQTIGGQSEFISVSPNNKGGIVMVQNLSQPTFIAKESGLGLTGSDRLYNSHSEAASSVTAAIRNKEKERREEWAKLSESEKKRQMNTLSYAVDHRYESVKIKRIITNNQLQVLSTEEGYIIR